MTTLERVLGSWAGRVSISDDIVGSDDEVIALFEKSAEEALVTADHQFVHYDIPTLDPRL